MVLADLGAKLTQALRKINSTTVMDETMLTDLLTDIASALLTSDVNIHYINNLRNSVKTQVSL
jgi:signal recognition particle GTPase